MSTPNPIHHPAAHRRKIRLLSLLIVGLTALLMRVIVGEVLRPLGHHDGMTGGYLQAAVILRSKTDDWKIMAAPSLALVACSAVFVSHYRERIFLFDWIVLLGAAVCFWGVVDFFDRQTGPAQIKA